MDGSEIPKKKSVSDEKDKKSGKDLLTVGIGASAGGVKALKDFFARMPADSGMAFAVMLHLSQTPSLIVNEDHEIVHLTENVGRYLRFVGGEPTGNLLKVANSALIPDLRAALFTAKQDGKTAETRPLPTVIEGEKCFVNVKIHPFVADSAAGAFLLVIFEESKSADQPFAESAPALTTLTGNQAIETIARRLEDELRRTKDRLRMTIEQQETSIEKLKASNEELQAMNEELRSTTEELETSREELQSVNEELTTVNSELKEKIEEVSSVNSDLQNLMHSADIGTIFLDRSLQIKRYTPRVQEIFNVIQTDIGRPLEHLTHNLDYTNLTEDAKQVLSSLRTVEREVQSKKGRHFIARLLPYRTLDDKIDGVVLTFMDITERKRAEEAKFFLASIVESSQDSIITINFDRIITSWNKGAENLYGYPAAEAIGKSLMMLSLPEDLNLVIANVDKVKHSQEVLIFDSVRINKSGREMDLEVAMSPVKNETGEVIGVSTIARDVTERRKAEEALRVSEENFRMMVDSVPESIWITDAEGRIEFLNKHWYEYCGETEGQSTAAEIAAAFLYPEDAPKVLQAFVEALRNGGEMEVEQRNRSATGEYRWFLNRARPYRDPKTGEIAKWIGVGIDIHDRKQAEAVLRHNQEMFSALVNNAPFGVYLIDSEFRLSSVNHGAQAVFSGINPLIGRDFAEILRLVWEEPFATEAIERFRHTLRTGEFYYSPRIIGKRSNTDKTESYDWQLHRITLPDETFGVVCYFYDLTDQLQMQNALRESEERLSLLIESIEDYAIITMTRDNRINSWNTGAERIFGYSEEEILGQSGDILFTPEDRAKGEPEKEVKSAIETGRAADERWHLRKDGSRFYASGVLTILGETPENGFVKILRDLTERKQFEDALKEGDRRKDEFLATLAHELRNPLAPIRTALEIMRRDEDKAKGQNAQEIIHRQTDMLVHLVDDLLDISRITQGKIKLRKEHFDIAEAINMAVETVQPFVESMRHRLDVRMPDAPLFIEADRSRIAQIINNLLHNSAKYTEPGGHILLIAGIENDQAVVRVRDNGIGIQFELLPQIFDMFAQTSAGEKRGQGGLGIGLSLVKKLVEMHNGRVEAHSEGEGKGSEFVVRLPLSENRKTERKQKKRAPEKTETEAHQILVVDDNADAATMLEMFLMMEKHEVRTAFTGGEALKTAAEFEPDTAILDIGLPDIDGFELAKRLRRCFPKIHLIALSGWGQEEDRRRSAEAGFDQHLVKPVDINELKRILAGKK